MRSVHSFPFAIVDIIACIVGLGLVFAPGGVAQAQHTDDNLPSGAFIYQRDVPPRPAEGPDVPAPPDYVVLGGKAELFSAMGLSPLSDTETSQISAEPAVRHNLLSETVSRSLGILTDNRDINRSSMAGERSSYTGSTISGAMNAVPAALGVLKSAFGADR